MQFRKQSTKRPGNEAASDPIADYMHAEKSPVIPHSQDIRERGYTLLYSEYLNFNLYK